MYLRQELRTDFEHISQNWRKFKNSLPYLPEIHPSHMQVIQSNLGQNSLALVKMFLLNVFSRLLICCFSGFSCV